MGTLSHRANACPFPSPPRQDGHWEVQGARGLQLPKRSSSRKGHDSGKIGPPCRDWERLAGGKSDLEEALGRSWCPKGSTSLADRPVPLRGVSLQDFSSPSWQGWASHLCLNLSGQGGWGPGS